MRVRNDHMNRCLECLLEAKNPESYLREHPAEADELRLLLKTAGLLTRYNEAIKPRPEFVARIQSRLEEACELKYGRRNKRPTRVFKAAGRWALSAAIALTLALFTFTGGFALASAASKNAVPGETLYSVKLATEKVRAVLVLSDSRATGLTQSVNAETEKATDEATNGAVETRATGPVGLDPVLVDIVHIDQMSIASQSGTNVKGLPIAGTPASGSQQPGTVGAGRVTTDNSSNIVSAPAKQTPATDMSGSETRDNPANSGLAPGQQPGATGGGAEVTNPGKSELAPGQQTPLAGGNGTDAGDKPGKSGTMPGERPQPTDGPAAGTQGKSDKR